MTAENEANPITHAILRAGLLNKAQLAEFQRWNTPNIAGVDESQVPTGPRPLEEAAALISATLQSEGFVLMRETNLEILHQYIATARPAKLHVEIDDQVSDVDIFCGRGLLGEYIIPWKSESIHEALTSGFTYLLDGETQIYFRDVRELFYGEKKAFMLCEPVK